MCLKVCYGVELFGAFRPCQPQQAVPDGKGPELAIR